MFDSILTSSLKHSLKSYGPTISRVPFDPSNREHLESARSFLKEGRWGNVQFLCEEPYRTVPETVIHKLSLNSIDRLIEIAEKTHV